jgi:hypothetical protein
MLKALHDLLVNLVAKVFHSAPVSPQHHRLVEIWQLALGLGVNPA